MFDEYLYIVKVYEDGETYEYEYGAKIHAFEHYHTELNKGNKADLFRYKDGKMQKYQTKPKCNCGKCKPKAKPKKIMPISRARNI